MVAMALLIQLPVCRFLTAAVAAAGLIVTALIPHLVAWPLVVAELERDLLTALVLREQQIPVVAVIVKARVALADQEL